MVVRYSSNPLVINEMPMPIWYHKLYFIIQFDDRQDEVRQGDEEENMLSSCYAYHA